MGALLEGIKTRQAGRQRGGRCTVGRALDELNPDDAADIKAAFADRSISATVIAEILTELGHDVSNFSAQRHQREDCRCGRDR